MSDTADGSADARSFRVLVSVVAVGGLVSIAAIIATHRFLYADSSNFLLTIWTSGSFSIPNPSRWFGFVATQWLPVLAMKMGWTNLGGLAALYGLNLWMNPVLAVAAAWWASGQSREVTLATLFCVLFMFQSTYLVLDNESNVFLFLASTLWILTLRRDFSYWALILFLPMLFSHEVAGLAFAGVLVVLLARRRRYLEYYGASRFWALVAGGALMVGGVALRMVTSDQGPNGRYFVEGALSLPGSPALVVTTVAFISLVTLSVRPDRRWLSVVFWTATGLLLLFPFLFPGWLWPFFHYRARILNAAVAFLLFGYLHGRIHWDWPKAPFVVTRRALVLAVVVFVFQGKATWEWSRHMDLFRDALAGQRGIVAFPLDGPITEPRSRHFSWSWTSPTRSVVFQAMEEGQVRALMLNADTTIWQPFDPRVPQELPDLSAFNVRYVPELTVAPGGR